MISNNPSVSCYVLAGGAGARLRPLTSHVAKPLLPFGGRYSLLDFTLSNVANSGIARAYVLSQYLKEDIGAYLRCNWRTGCRTRFIHQPPAQGTSYGGTVEAVVRNLDKRPSDTDTVLVLAADHVYRMDYRRLIQYHREQGATMTLAALPVELDAARQLGVLSTGPGGRVTAFEEKPDRPSSMPGEPGRALASMGIYVFSLKALQSLSRISAVAQMDFGRDLIPLLVETGEAAAYPVTQQEGDSFYWRDVGTPSAYHKSNMDFLGTRPPFNLWDTSRPIRFDSAQTADSGYWMWNSAIWPWSVVSSLARLEECNLEQSVVSPGVVVEKGANVLNSILLPGARVGRKATVRNAIVAQGGVVDSYAKIGVGLSSDVDAEWAEQALIDEDVVIVPDSAYAGQSRAFRPDRVAQGMPA